MYYFYALIPTTHFFSILAGRSEVSNMCGCESLDKTLDLTETSLTYQLAMIASLHTGRREGHCDLKHTRRRERHGQEGHLTNAFSGLPTRKKRTTRWDVNELRVPNGSQG